MLSNKKNILFLSHDASRTGAPILLLNLASILKESDNWSFSFLLKRAGTIIQEFEAIGSVKIFYKPVKYDLISRAKRKFIKPVDHYDLSKLNWSEFDVVFANTLTNGDILPIVQKYFKGPVISYIHELEMAAQFFTDEVQVKKLIECTTHFAVPSLAVKTFLEKKYSIDPVKISYLPYYIPKLNKEQVIAVKQHQYSRREFVVGGSGTTDWRKSPELFVQVAATVYKERPDAAIKFIWKGGANQGIEFERLSYDIRKCGLSGKVLFEEAGSDMPAFFNKLDLFLLTSREDPYPLVVLEAAAAAVPTVCFAGAGGAPEFVEMDAGTVVPFLDIQTAAEEILHFYDNPSLLQSKSKCAKEKVLSKHQDDLSICEQFKAVINKVLINNETKANSHIPTAVPSHS